MTDKIIYNPRGKRRKYPHKRLKCRRFKRNEDLIGYWFASLVKRQKPEVPTVKQLGEMRLKRFLGRRSQT